MHIPYDPDLFAELNFERYELRKTGKILFKHYHPGGNAYRVILIDNLVKEGSYTREQIYRMACQAHKEDQMMLEYNSKNGHHFPSQYTYENLEAVSLTRKGLGREYTYPPKGTSMTGHSLNRARLKFL